MAGLAVTSLLLYCTYSAILFMAAGHQENVVIIMHTRAMIHLPLLISFFIDNFFVGTERMLELDHAAAGDVYSCCW